VRILEDRRLLLRRCGGNAMTARVFSALLCFTAITAERATAQDAVLPRSDGQSGLCEPFECETRIQQVFDAALFTGPIRIDALQLFNNVPHSAESFVEPARYRFRLSTTQVSSTTITTEFDANLGPDQRTVAVWTVSTFDIDFETSMTIRLKRPFVYDPAAGNLLLEITKNQTAGYGDGPIYVDGHDNAPGVALVTATFGVEVGKGMTIGFLDFVRGR
jgi:hypothetical protein